MENFQVTQVWKEICYNEKCTGSAIGRTEFNFTHWALLSQSLNFPECNLFFLPAQWHLTILLGGKSNGKYLLNCIANFIIIYEV